MQLNEMKTLYGRVGTYHSLRKKARTRIRIVKTTVPTLTLSWLVSSFRKGALNAMTKKLSSRSMPSKMMRSQVAKKALSSYRKFQKKMKRRKKKTPSRTKNVVILVSRVTNGLNSYLIRIQPD